MCLNENINWMNKLDSFIHTGKITLKKEACMINNETIVLIILLLRIVLLCRNVVHRTDA